MKLLYLTLFIVVFNTFASGQSFSSAVAISTIYSQNEEFYLKSIPFDNESPSLRGKTSVYRKGNETPLYVLERGFDFSNENYLTLSNNGEVIFYVISWGAKEDTDGLKSISIYKNGELTKSFTEPEITGCDYRKERCELIYSNSEDVLDDEKSGWKAGKFNKVFKEGVGEKEKFLFDFPLFNFDNIVYLIDSKKKVHKFDLKEGSYLGADSFEEVFSQIKDKGRLNKLELQRFDAGIYPEFPNLLNGKSSHESLAALLDMKTASNYGKDLDDYKIYRFKIEGFVSQNGTFELENIEIDEDLPKEKVLEFFNSNKFLVKNVPSVFPKWYFTEYFYFRNKDEKIARREKQQEIIKQREDLKKRLVAEKINDIYIPKDLSECFTELDKLLPEISRKELLATKKEELIGEYHMGLGMWIRNNWGLWGGSRLQKYFTDKKINHPDDMSSVILEYYYDWLHGKTETWKDWENKFKK